MLKIEPFFADPDPVFWFYVDQDRAHWISSRAHFYFTGVGTGPTGVILADSLRSNL